MTPENLELAFKLIPTEFWNTLYMVLSATILAVVVGCPLGVILTITDHGHLKDNPILHKIIGLFVNIGRSFPFAILMIALIPLTRTLVGTSLGTTAAIIPLGIAAIPFVARQVEAALKEVGKEVLEVAIVIGSSPWQIITKVLIPEALPSIFLGLTTTVINLIGYSAMAGFMGGGGLGQVAIQYGYQRYNSFIIVLTVVLLILLVQLVQFIGNHLVKTINVKRGRSQTCSN